MDLNYINVFALFVGILATFFNRSFFGWLLIGLCLGPISIFILLFCGTYNEEENYHGLSKK